MTPVIVGCNVGFYVGKSDRPDINRPSRMNNIARDCRECRVLIEEETVREFRNSAHQARGVAQTLHLLGLE
jgi:hypothetical protein